MLLRKTILCIKLCLLITSLDQIKRSLANSDEIDATDHDEALGISSHAENAGDKRKRGTVSLGTKKIDDNNLIAEVKKWENTHRKGTKGMWKAIHGLVMGKGGGPYTQKDYRSLYDYYRELARSIRLKAVSYVKNPPFTLTNPQINSICM